MRVFIGCETSGMARNAFAALGHDVLSCDLLPAEDGSDRHIIGDIFATLDALARRGWTPDLGILHPTCTFHTLSAAWAFNDPDYDRYPGVGYHQKVQPGTLVGAARREARELAEADVERIKALPFKKAIENPRGTIPTRTSLGNPIDVVQPNEFGHDASKETCLWFFDENGNPMPSMALPRDPAKRVVGRMVEWPRGSGIMVERWGNQTDSGQNNLSPDGERWKERSRTFPGISNAMAATWCSLERLNSPLAGLIGSPVLLRLSQRNNRSATRAHKDQAAFSF